MITSLRKLGKQLGLRTPVLWATSSDYRRVRRLAKPLLQSIRADGVDTVYAKHRNSTHGYRKYFDDIDLNFEYVVENAIMAGLVGVPRKRVLDIGCGPGYFLYVLQRLGHDVVGLDVEDTEIFNDLIRELRVPRVMHRVEAFKPMPPLGESFDVITAFGIVFDLHRSENIWGPAQWDFFIKDCQGLLRPGGKILLRFNPATTQPFDFIRDDIADMLRSFPDGHLSPSKEFFTLTLGEFHAS